MYLTETGQRGVNRIHVVRDKWQGLVKAIKKLQAH